MIVDFHNHYQPPKYLEALERGPSAVRITRDVEGNPCWIILSDYNIAVRASHHARNPRKPITSVDPEAINDPLSDAGQARRHGNRPDALNRN